MNPTIITGPRLRLRPWKEEDIPLLPGLANNRKIWLGLRDRFPHPYQEAHAREWIEFQGKNLKHHHFAVEWESHLIGGAGLEVREDVHRLSAEVGYWLGEPFWGRGLATEVVKLLCAWGFKNLEIIRIDAEIFSDNPASMRVLEKAGFTQECRQKNKIFKNGKILDAVCFRLERE